MKLALNKWAKSSFITLIVMCVSQANATIIDFEDGNNQRADLGFNTANTGGDYMKVIGGEGNGDPGSWSLEGSNGSQLLGSWSDWNGGGGYNGIADTTYSSIYFTEANSSTRTRVDVTFDALLATGNYSGNDFTFFGFKDGLQVAQYSASFSATTINTYSEYIDTISFTDVDEIRFDGNKPFGMDNFEYEAIPEPSVIALSAFIGGGLLFVRRIFMM